MSEQERISWISLIVNVVIGALYFSRVFALPADADLFGPRTGLLAAGLIGTAIAIAIISEVLMRIVEHGSGATSNKAERDERDVLIELKANRNGHYVLGFAVIAVLVQVALLEWAQRRGRPLPEPDTVLELLATGPLQTMHVAQLLLLALTLGAITVNASRVCYYRRDG